MPDPLDYAEPEFFYRHQLWIPLTQMAERGNREAQLLLARHAEKSPDTLRQAYSWYRRYAESGNGRDWDYVASFLKTHGTGPADEQEKLCCLRKAFEYGNISAAIQLAMHYQWYDSTPALAAYWYGQAAAKDDIDGLYELALCYQDGNGVERSPVKAQELLRRAAQHKTPCSPIRKLAQRAYLASVNTHGLLPLPKADTLFPLYPCGEGV